MCIYPHDSQRLEQHGGVTVKRELFQKDIVISSSLLVIVLRYTVVESTLRIVVASS